ncbi:MAG: hypothetical protein V1754_11050 [Pseudomonadota bacterium]
MEMIKNRPLTLKSLNAFTQMNLLCQVQKKTDPQNPVQAWGATMNSLADAPKTKSIDELIAYLLKIGASPMTIMLAAQIYETGLDANRMLKEIQDLRKWRDAIQTRIDELRALKAFIEKHSKDGKIDKDELLKKMGDFLKEHPGIKERYPNLMDCPNGSQNYATAEWTLLSRQQFVQDADTGEITTKNVGSFMDAKKVTANDLEAAIEEHRSSIQKLDSAKEIMTMSLQETVQRKQRLTTLASNIADASHRGQEAVVKNIRS